MLAKVCAQVAVNSYETILTQIEVGGVVGKVVGEVLNLKTGYRGVAYVYGDVVVIGHRGTCSIKDLIVDAKYGLGLGVETSVEGSTFVEKIMEMCGDEIKYIQTGHSLGALIAEVCADKFEHQAITFDSPGTKGLIKNVEWAQQNFSTYMGKKNLVNTWNSHLGQVYQVKYSTKISDKVLTWVRRGSWFLGTSMLATAVTGMHTLNRHSIVGIADSMDNTKLKKNWPSNTCQFFLNEMDDDLFKPSKAVKKVILSSFGWFGVDVYITLIFSRIHSRNLNTEYL